MKLIDSRIDNDLFYDIHNTLYHIVKYNVAKSIRDNYVVNMLIKLHNDHNIRL